MLRQLKELLLFQNQLSRLPYELGSLFQMQTLGLHGNPLSEPWLTYVAVWQLSRPWSSLRLSHTHTHTHTARLLSRLFASTV